MNYYTCGNCHENSDTLISHPQITGENEGFDPKCFRLMANILHDLKKQCPVCNEAKHNRDCLILKIRGNDENIQAYLY